MSLDELNINKLLKEIKLCASESISDFYKNVNDRWKDEKSEILNTTFKNKLLICDREALDQFETNVLLELEKHKEFGIYMNRLNQSASKAIKKFITLDYAIQDQAKEGTKYHDNYCNTYYITKKGISYLKKHKPIDSYNPDEIYYKYKIDDTIILGQGFAYEVTDGGGIINL